MAKKTQEAIGNLRSRAEQTQYTPQLTGSVAADADAVFAEKDSLIQALNGELQQLKGKTVDLERQISDLEVQVADKERELSTVRSELRKAEERKPSQVLETLVFKLKKQLAEKERKQNDLQGAIKDLRNEMHKAAGMRNDDDMFSGPRMSVLGRRSPLLECVRRCASTKGYRTSSLTALP